VVEFPGLAFGEEGGGRREERGGRREEVRAIYGSVSSSLLPPSS
jgi:hypothetical protein